MGSIPEGAKTVSAEAADVKSAVESAAAELEISPRAVSYKLDMDHFRSAAGGSVSRNTVKIIAWENPEGEVAPAAPAPRRERSDDDARPERAERPERAPRRDDDGERRERKPRRDDEGGERRERRERKPRRDDEGGERRERRPRREDVAFEGSETEASKAAGVWFTELLPLMGLEGTVSALGDDERVRLEVKVDNAGRLIGRRGATLAAVRHLLKMAIADLGDFIIDVDIPDGRNKEDRPERGDREERRPRGRDRGDRGDRGGRGRDRDRGGDDRRPRGPKGDYPEEKLQAVAARAAEKAVETGRPVTINIVLNSYDRHVVHAAVAEIEGVKSESVIKDDKKYIQISVSDED